MNSEARALEIRENVSGMIRQLMRGGGHWRDLYPGMPARAGGSPEYYSLRRLVECGEVTKVCNGQLSNTRYSANKPESLHRYFDSEDELTWLIWPNRKPPGTEPYSPPPPEAIEPAVNHESVVEESAPPQADEIQAALLKLMAANIERLAYLTNRIDSIDQKLEELCRLWKT